MSRYADELSSYIEQEVPEQEKIIEMIGGGNTNRSNLNLWLVDPEERGRTQQEIADELGVQVRLPEPGRWFHNSRLLADVAEACR